MRASITLPSDRAELARLQAFAGEFAHRSGLPSEERARLLVILEELFTNAVSHGYGPHSRKGSVTVRLRWKNPRLAIDFVDDGQAFDPLAVEGPDLDAEGKERAIGGLGIHIVRSLVDEAGYRRKAGRNHLHLARRI